MSDPRVHLPNPNRAVKTAHLSVRECRGGALDMMSQIPDNFQP